MRISSTRIEPLMMPVTIIQRPLFVAFLIFPDDSNVESSNMASLESSVCYFFLDTAGAIIVPRASKLRQTNVLHTYTKQHPDLQRMRCSPGKLNGVQNKAIPQGIQMRARLAAGRATAFPLLARHSCHATSMGAAIAMDE